MQTYEYASGTYILIHTKVTNTRGGQRDHPPGAQHPWSALVDLTIEEKGRPHHPVTTLRHRCIGDIFL